MVEKNPFIIAEIGINHQGSMKRAFKLINAAKKSGASAVKFQTYITEKRVKKNSPIFNILKNVNFHLKILEQSRNIVIKKNFIFFRTF